jgi:hypothetical protein
MPRPYVTINLEHEGGGGGGSKRCDPKITGAKATDQPFRKYARKQYRASRTPNPIHRLCVYTVD